MTVPDLILLHTSPVHVPVFDALRDRHHPGAVLRHLVVPELLDRARAHGPSSVAPALLELLAGAGPGPALVTCSTIGATAEALAPAVGAPVLRVDRPMAAAAVRTGPRIAVLAALASTLAPTAELLAEEAGGRPVSVRTHLVAGAWECFEAGDTARYLAHVADAADARHRCGRHRPGPGVHGRRGRAGHDRDPRTGQPRPGPRRRARPLALTAAPQGRGTRTGRNRGKVPYMVRTLEDTQPPAPEPDPKPAPNPFPDPEPVPRPVPPVPGPVPEPDPIPPPPGPAPVPQPGPWS